MLHRAFNILTLQPFINILYSSKKKPSMITNIYSLTSKQNCISTCFPPHLLYFTVHQMNTTLQYLIEDWFWDGNEFLIFPSQAATKPYTQLPRLVGSLLSFGRNQKCCQIKAVPVFAFAVLFSFIGGSLSVSDNTENETVETYFSIDHITSVLHFCTLPDLERQAPQIFYYTIKKFCLYQTSL